MFDHIPDIIVVLETIPHSSPGRPFSPSGHAVVDQQLV
jgi:hypothetical protein